MIEIYNANKEILVNKWLQLQALKEQGVNIGSLEEDAFRELELLIELEDSKKLADLRKELHVDMAGSDPVNSKHHFTTKELENL